MLRAIVFVALLALVKGQSVNITCDFINKNETIDFARLDGKWYEEWRIPNDLESGHCSSITFSESAKTLVIREVVSDEENFINGTYTHATNDSKFVLTINNTHFDMYVVSTNYDGYALIYSCGVQQNNSLQVGGWGLRRNATLSQAEQDAINQIISENPDLSTLMAVSVDHSEAACKVNSGTSLRISVALLMFIFVAFKSF